MAKEKKGKETKKGKDKPKPKKKAEAKKEVEEQTALAITLNNDKALGQIFVDSGFFEDATKQSQAIVKVLAGREIGIAPIEAMTGIHIVKGKVTLGANLMAAAVKKHPNYNYKVIEHSPKECVIDFFEDGEKVGRSEFTLEDARNAGVLKPGGSWSKYPRNMLFARAMSNGVKWYCPDVFGHAPVYLPEEMGMEVDGDGQPINVTPEKIAEPLPEKPPVKDADYKDVKEEEPEEEPEEVEIPDDVVDKDMTPRDAIRAIMDYAFHQEIGDKVRPIIEKHYEPWKTGEPNIWNIPEKACIEIVKELTEIELSKAEKVKTCKADDCKAKITEPEAEEQQDEDGKPLCLEHFKEYQEEE